MRIPLLVIAMLCANAYQLHAQPAPGLGTWRLDDGRVIKLRTDNTAAIWEPGKQILEGKWEIDPFSEKVKRLIIKWNHGVMFDVEVSPDAQAIRGKRIPEVNNSPQLAGKQVEEIRVFMWADDVATLWVNGVLQMRAGISKSEEGRIFVRSGDVITLNLANKSGAMELGFEAFKGTEKFLSAGDLYYTEAPEIDWQITPKMAMGYRQPLARAKRNFVIGPVKDPLIGTPQKQDEKFRKIHFKYVVK